MLITRIYTAYDKLDWGLLRAFCDRTYFAGLCVFVGFEDGRAIGQLALCDRLERLPLPSGAPLRVGALSEACLGVGTLRTPSPYPLPP